MWKIKILGGVREKLVFIRVWWWFWMWFCGFGESKNWEKLGNTGVYRTLYRTKNGILGWGVSGTDRGFSATDNQLKNVNLPPYP